MKLAPLRPVISELSIALLRDKPLLPVLAERSVAWSHGGFTIQITTAGHCIQWKNRNQEVIEAVLPACDVTSAWLELPARHERRGRHRGDGWEYQLGVQVERVNPDLFLHMHDELLAEKQGFVYRFGPTERVSMTPLSLVRVETVAGGLAIASFHTFPDEYAIFKTQSLIESQ